MPNDDKESTTGSGKKVMVTPDKAQQAKRNAKHSSKKINLDNTHIQDKPKYRMSRQRILLAGALMLVGIVLVSYQPIINYVIGPHQLEKAYSNNISAETIQENIERYKTLDSSDDTLNELFDYDSVKMLTTLDVNPTIQTKSVIGGLYVPSVDLVIPIMYGVTQDILLNSAGTMKPNQEMGVGNYALIGHNSKNPNVLFAPIHRINEGDKMYVTNKQGVYEYEMTSHTVVDPSEIEVIEDIEGINSLTLISCTPDGKERVIVQGELVAVHMYDVAPAEVVEVFNDL